MLRFSRPFSCRFQPQSGWFWPFQLGGDAPISPFPKLEEEDMQMPMAAEDIEKV
jgi:hypothetical protein